MILALVLLLAALPTVEDGIRRVQAHLLIDDPTSALQEAQTLTTRFPTSREAASSLVEALSAAGRDDEALRQWTQLSAHYPDLIGDRNLLEELSWGVLKKAMGSTQHNVRLASLIGMYLTHDVRAAGQLVKMMRDSNAMIRSVAVQMAADYGD